MSTSDQIREHIRALEDLAAMDAEIKVFEERLTEERGVLIDLTESLKRLDARLAIDRAAVVSADQQIRDLHADLRNTAQQIEHSREKLNRSRTERETNAAQRELEELRKLVRDREDEITRLGNDTASVRAAVEASEAEHKRITEDLAAKEGDIKSTVSKLEADKSERGGGRDSLVKRLPPVLYRRYELLRSKRGTAVAQTSDGICNKCNMALPPQLYHRLRREPLIEQCQSCNRIIYFVSPTSVDNVD